MVQPEKCVAGVCNVCIYLFIYIMLNVRNVCFVCILGKRNSGRRGGAVSGFFRTPESPFLPKLFYIKKNVPGMRLFPSLALKGIDTGQQCCLTRSFKKIVYLRYEVRNQPSKEVCCIAHSPNSRFFYLVMYFLVQNFTQKGRGKSIGNAT